MNRTRVLVVDDKEEEGLHIALALHREGFSPWFVKYDQAHLQNKVYGSHSGVWCVVMDIDLLGGGLTGSESTLAFGTVESAILALLEENNGPFVLVTWSRHDESAAGLFEHLKERLPERMRPFKLLQLDKESFLSESSDLCVDLRRGLGEIPALSCLMNWENAARSSACEVSQTLFEAAKGIGSGDTGNNLRHVLCSLARAHAGKTLRQENVLSSLYSVLAPLLADRIQTSCPPESGLLEESPQDRPTDIDGNWWRQVNAMLHLDFPPNYCSGPGTAYEFPLPESDLPVPLCPPDKREEFIRKHFPWEKGSGLSYKRGINTLNINDCKLVIVDVTPPCDYAQEKSGWRKFVVGVKVNLNIPPGQESETLLEQKNAEYLKISPEFDPRQPSFLPFSLALNARLVTAIPDNVEFLRKLGTPMFRIRSQLLMDISSWLSRHASRPGHVFLGKG